jgi:hypothetical protein
MVSDILVHCGWTDVAGVAGVSLIVGSYFWLQIGRWSTDTKLYSAANALGASLVLISLCISFNFSALLIESFWLVISLFGLVRKLPRNGRA